MSCKEAVLAEVHERFQLNNHSFADLVSIHPQEATTTPKLPYIQLLVLAPDQLLRYSIKHSSNP